MSTPKHTPGPWLFRGKSESVHARCETHPYGEVLFQFNDECAPSDQDLNLILASPYMLEALQMVMRRGRIDDSEEAMNQVAAAIAKATGEA